MHYQKVKKDVRIAVYDLNPKGKHVVFFIHGWPLSHKIFEYQYEALPKSNIRCISMDLRGFGMSDKPWSGYSYDDFVDDIYEVIRNLDVDNITMLGFSMGASLAIRYMLKHNSYRVSKLALVSPVAPNVENSIYEMSDEKIDKLIRKIYLDRSEMIKEFCDKLFESRLTTTLKKWIHSLCYETSGYVTIKTAKALKDKTLYDNIDKINVPTAIFHGIKDRMSPFKAAVELKEKIDNSKLYSFENSGHAVFFDEMERFNKELIEFISN